MAGDIPKVNVAAKDRVLLHLLANDEWEPYVSDSAYARGAQSPSGVRYFFDGTEDNLQLAYLTAPLTADLRRAEPWSSQT